MSNYIRVISAETTINGRRREQVFCLTVSLLSAQQEEGLLCSNETKLTIFHCAQSASCSETTMGDQIGQSANPGHSTQICGRLTLQEQRQLPRPQPGQDPRNFDGGLASIKTSETLPEPEKDEVSPSTTIVCSSEGTLPASHKHFQKPTFELHGIRRCSESSGPTQSAGWVPSILRAGPILGLIALVFATLQVVASYAVLKASNGDAVANWKYQPTVSKVQA